MEKHKGASMPNIFYYVYYADFFKDCYEAFKKSDPSFSYTHIANKGDFRSRTQVRGFIKGTLKPNISQIKTLANIFGIENRQTKYLMGLYHLNHADNSSVALDLFRKLIDQQNQAEIKDNPFREIEVAASLLHLTLLSFVECEGFVFDPGWICEKLAFTYSPKEISTAFKELIQLGYVVQSEDKNYKPAQSYIKKIDHTPNFLLRRFHNECLEVAQKSIEEASMEDRFLVASTIAIPKENFHKIRQKVLSFLDSLVLAEKATGEKTDVVQVNVQMVRTAHMEKSKSDDNNKIALRLNEGEIDETC